MEVPKGLKAALGEPLMSAAVQRELLDKAQSGDEGALNELTLSYSRMVWKLTDWTTFEGIREDLIQEGFVILRRAILRYSPARGVPLHNWLAQQLRWRLLKLVQKETLHRQRFPLHAEASGPLVLQRIGIADTEREVASTCLQVRVLVEDALADGEITAGQAEMLDEWLQESTMREIAERRGLHRMTVSRHLAKVRAVLKERARC